MNNLSYLPLRGLTSRQVLREIYHRGPVSRAVLARSTGLAAPTISEIASGLLNQGLIEEIGQGPSTGGKRPTLLRLVDDARQLIGLDLARGDFRGAVMNLRGEIRHRVELPLKDRAGEPALAQVMELVERLMGLADRPLLGIGIGAPGLVNTVDGVVCHAVNVDWRNLPLADLLRERSGLPVYLANDCDAAALAESLFGPHGADENLVVVNVGYGVGAGIMVNGRLLHGSPYGAGEIGHMVMADAGKGARCNCGKFGCLETLVSSPAILRRAAEAGVVGLAGSEDGDDEAVDLTRSGAGLVGGSELPGFPRPTAAGHDSYPYPSPLPDHRPGGVPPPLPEGASATQTADTGASVAQEANTQASAAQTADGVALDSSAALEELRRRGENGDAAAQAVIAETGRWLGAAVGNVLSVLGCSRVLFAGSVVSLGDGLLAAARAEVQQRVVSPVAEESPVGFAASGADIVLRGASVLVLSQELGLL